MNFFRSLSKSTKDLILIGISGILFYLLAMRYDIFEWLVEFTRKYEKFEIDEFIILALYGVVALAVFAWRRWQDSHRLSQKLQLQNQELEQAMKEIRELRGIIPICMFCKKIRDDQGFWHQVEVYIAEHSSADFSHGVCPECKKKFYEESALSPED